MDEDLMDKGSELDTPFFSLIANPNPMGVVPLVPTMSTPVPVTPSPQRELQPPPPPVKKGGKAKDKTKFKPPFKDIVNLAMNAASVDTPVSRRDEIRVIPTECLIESELPFDKEIPALPEIERPIRRIINMQKMVGGTRNAEGYRMRMLRGRGRPPKVQKSSGESDGGVSEDSGTEERIRKNKNLPSSPEVVNWLQENYEPWESTTVPRATIYFHYRLFCEEHGFQMLNQASFGKAIRMVFPILQTRRLGSRGNSKYHYDGIRIRGDSKYAHITCDDEHQEKFIHPDTIKSKMIRRPKSINLRSFYPKKNLLHFNTKWNSRDLEFNLGSIELNQFPVIELSAISAFDPAYMHAIVFEALYKEHWRLMFEQFCDLNLSEYEVILACFWRAPNASNFIDPPKGIPYYDESLSRDAMENLLENPFITKFVQKVDIYCYQTLLDLLFPDVSSPSPEPFNDIFKKFSISFGRKLRSALVGYHPSFIELKMSAYELFRHSINFLSHLNHLSRIQLDFFPGLESDLSFGPLLLRAVNRLNFAKFAKDYFDEESSGKLSSWLNFEMSILVSFTTQAPSFREWGLQLRLLLEAMFGEDRNGFDPLDSKIKQFSRYWNILLEKLKRLIFNHCPENLRLYYYFFEFMREYTDYYAKLMMADNAKVPPIFYLGAGIEDFYKNWTEIDKFREIGPEIGYSGSSLVRETREELNKRPNTP